MSPAAYVDSSVLLRFIFDEPGKLGALKGFSELYSSDLTRAECLRTCHRARLEGRFGDEELSDRVVRAMHVLKTLYLIPVSRLVITKSAQPYPVHIRTLDSIHLSTALLLIDRKSGDIPLLTHDMRLAQAAKAMGMEVIAES